MKGRYITAVYRLDEWLHARQWSNAHWIRPIRRRFCDHVDRCLIGSINYDAQPIRRTKRTPDEA